MRSTMHKVILYYKFTPVSDPEAVKLWQRNLCERLGLQGRIIVSEHGINGTLGGNYKSVRAYVRETTMYEPFRNIEFKWSNGTGEDFPRLSVKVRPELVTLDPEIEFDVFDAGIGLRPAQWHRLLEENPDITLLDARNHYESSVGRFKGAITPKIDTFKQIKTTIDELDPSEPVATYCTGDIRCEYLSAYLKHRGFETVYHLDGGIVKYGEEFGNKGLWDGACYVFDKRKQVTFGKHVELVGTCSSCANATNKVVNCANIDCPKQLVVCESCEPTLVCETCAKS
jgi:UPF0176 protein